MEQTSEEQAAFESAQRVYFMHRDEKLAAWSWGEGLTVFLLHGWESQSGHMNAFLPYLLDAGFRILAFDAPCHGQSEGTVTDAVDYGRAVQSAVEAFGAPVAMIGHSVGSAAALFAFSQSVTLKASVHIAGPSSMERVLRRGANAAGLDEAGTQYVLQKMARQIGKPLAVMDLDHLHPGFKHPALILHDPDDREMPYTESIALSEAWSGSRLEPIAGVGHRRIIRNEYVVQSAVQFIAAAI